MWVHIILLLCFYPKDAQVVLLIHMYTFVLLALPMQYARAYFLDLQFLHEDLYKLVDHALLTYVCHVLGRNYCFICKQELVGEKYRSGTILLVAVFLFCSCRSAGHPRCLVKSCCVRVLGGPCRRLILLEPSGQLWKAEVLVGPGWPGQVGLGSANAPAC